MDFIIALESTAKEDLCIELRLRHLTKNFQEGSRRASGCSNYFKIQEPAVFKFLAMMDQKKKIRHEQRKY